MELSSVIEQLNWRMATKNFDPDRKILESDFELLLEALRLTASSYGLQPWKFVVVKNPEVRAKLLPASYGQKQVVDASHLVVLCAKKSLGQVDVNEYILQIAKTRGLKPEELDSFKDLLNTFIGSKDQTALKIWAVKQVYIALGNLLTTCAITKIDACPMEGFDTSSYDQILGLEKLGLTSVVACPLGYRLENAPEIKNKKVRFDTNQLVVEI